MGHTNKNEQHKKNMRTTKRKGQTNTRTNQNKMQKANQQANKTQCSQTQQNKPTRNGKETIAHNIKSVKERRIKKMRFMKTKKGIFMFQQTTKVFTKSLLMILGNYD